MLHLNITINTQVSLKEKKKEKQICLIKFTVKNICEDNYIYLKIAVKHVRIIYNILFVLWIWFPFHSK